MPTPTYDIISSYTVPSSTSAYTFSSIPSTYTDLELIIVGKGTGAGDYWQMRMGNTTLDTGANYSYLDIYASGSTGNMGSGGGSSLNQLYVQGFGGTLNSANTGPVMAKVTIFDYANTTTHKKALMKSAGLRDGGGYAHSAEMMHGSWRSNSAVNTIQIFTPSYLMAAGTTLNLYGIKAGS